ncbi:hypothetical protein MY04_2865 [Flammeovirga sp. MY04]|uniref:lipopolysaccharide biosynthesis protein n=1 Tax=Flammeovirga sp. MY04 TaxID=1191459 RepID=UPI00130512D5|nr:hypothetical protein [Flammeovirga sp. MY04]ANQ50233.2 hypothetical protein MY04_2865 [Flammeovirga sp. MY04]
MTWASMIGKIGNVLLILPLLLRTFPVEVINLWFLFQLIFSFKDILDLGLVNNISRAYSYALGGSVSLNEFSINQDEPNYQLIFKIEKVSRKVYLYVTIIAFVLLLFLGPISLFKTINSIDGNYNEYWLSWVILLISIVFSLFGNSYTSFLIGVNKVAEMRRTDAIINLFSLLLTAIVTLLYPSFILIVTTFYFMHVALFLKNRFLCKKVKESYPVTNVEFDSKVWDNIQSRAKRSFAAGIGGYGVNIILNVVVSNLIPVNLSAAYLFANRVIMQINQISVGAFDPNLPKMSVLEAQNRKKEQINLVNKSMNLSYLIITLGVFGVYLFSHLLLDIISSKTEFITFDIWFLLSLAILLERFSIMHRQYYTLMTNTIIAHKIVIVTGIIKIILFYVLFPFMDIYALPISYIFSLIIFESWFIFKKSYEKSKATLFNFEKLIFIPSCILFIIFYFVNMLHV